MQAPPLKGIGLALDRDLQRQRTLLVQAKAYQLHTARKSRPLTPAELSSITELAFLKVFLAWERFLPRWTPKTGQSWTPENRPVR